MLLNAISAVLEMSDVTFSQATTEIQHAKNEKRSVELQLILA